MANTHPTNRSTRSTKSSIAFLSSWVSFWCRAASLSRLMQWNAAGIHAFYFRGPDNHSLEVLQFPADTSDPNGTSPEQEHLDDVFGARLGITSLRAEGVRASTYSNISLHLMPKDSWPGVWIFFRRHRRRSFRVARILMGRSMALGTQSNHVVQVVVSERTAKAQW